MLKEEILRLKASEPAPVSEKPDVRETVASSDDPPEVEEEDDDGIEIDPNPSKNGPTRLLDFLRESTLPDPMIAF